MTTDVVTAEREAEAARAAVADAEQGIKTGKRKVSASRLVEIVTRARHSELAAQEARDRAERERQDARRLALEALGAEIDAAASEAGAGIAEALGELATAAARVRSCAAVWDARAAELAAAAHDLGARGPVPGGARRADQGIAVSNGTVRHERTVLKPVGPQLGPAIAHAVAGDVVSAQAAVRATEAAPEPKRADHYYRGRGGMILPVYADLSANQMSQVRTGDLVELSESQILAYLDGDPV